MKCSAIVRMCLVATLFSLVGCGDDDDSSGGSGGKSAAGGGSSAGNAGATTGGRLSTGGATARGGAASEAGAGPGGTGPGGAAQGGSLGEAGSGGDGVVVQGGAGPQGGTSAGGATSGGTSAGGTSAQGGVSAGGTTSAGGSANGGATSGGASNGGASNGGTNAGGTAGVGGVTSSGGAGGAQPFVYWVAQANGTTSASLSSGVFTLSNTYGPSGNAFKYVAPNYYGTNSNGFIALPTTMSGDFSISAEVTITAQNKANNACGIGLGLTTGFNPTDVYAYTLMRNSNNSTNGYYVSGLGAQSAGSPAVAFTNGTPLALAFTRTGNQVTFSAGPVGGAATTQSMATSFLTNGTTLFGSGGVYPAISFNNVNATVTKLAIKDANGATVYDSATGALVKYVPASLTLSSAATAVRKGSSTSVTATALAVGGSVANVTATATDPTVVQVDVVNGTSNSTINLSGLKGGVTTVTVTNSADSNTTTNSKTFTVSVNDFPTSDAYGSLASVAYPVPGATNAYPDGDIALTFDAAPTLNVGGSIKILKQSDGTEVDSISFANETETFGSTVINVGSQLVKVTGNTLLVRPHPKKLAYGTSYYVAIPTTSITGTLGAAAFNGLSDSNAVATWRFTTRSAPSLSAGNVSVDSARTSTADFRSLQGALDAIGTSLATAPNVQINVAAGSYEELLRFTGTPLGAGQTVRISGPNGNTQGDNCVVQWQNGNAMNGSTQTRAAFYFSGANLVLENLTFKNTALRSVVSQAEAIYFAGGTAGTTLAAYNSTFSSNQDTIQTSGRNWFYGCRIEGNVDFIWGTADAALFEDCDLRVVNDLGAAASYSVVVARTGTTIAAGASGTVGKGYVLMNSQVSVDANVTAYFGRNAGGSGFYDQAALVNVAFSGAGTLGAGLWNVTTVPLGLGDASYVGWKSTGCSGLNLGSLTTATGTSATIAAASSEYDTRDHILNRVVTVTAGAPSGYQAAATAWDTSSLATAWGAP